MIAAAPYLDEHGIPYLLTGSIASSLYGEPRLTHDIDVVVSISVEAAVDLARAFPPPWYYLDDRESIREMIDASSMFNLIDTQTGDKIDFWILTDEPFDRSRFAPSACERLRLCDLGFLARRHHTGQASMGEPLGRKREAVPRCAASLRCAARTPRHRVLHILGS